MLTSETSLAFPPLSDTTNNVMMQVFNEVRSPEAMMQVGNEVSPEAMMQVSNKNGPVNGILIKEVIFKFLRHNGYHFEDKGWDSETSIYVKSSTQWKCPCGHLHKDSNHFHVVLD